MALKSNSRSRTRRMIMPLLVVVFALGVYWFVEPDEPRRSDEVGAAVRDLCTAVMAGEPAPRDLLEVELARPIRARLESVANRPGVSPDQLSIEVTPGDDGAYGDGSATHTIIVRVDGAPVLGLRAIHSGDPSNIRIIGFWAP